MKQISQGNAEGSNVIEIKSTEQMKFNSSTQSEDKITLEVEIDDKKESKKHDAKGSQGIESSTGTKAALKSKR